MPLFKQSFADSQLEPGLFALLETSFPGLTAQAARGKAVGLPWGEASVPFVKFQNGQPICHVGMLEVPLRVMGSDPLIGGIHAVCTHPDFRRQGHFREVMKDALAFCQERCQAVVLFTNQPELYTGFDFRPLEEKFFRFAWEQGPGTTAGRRLDLSSAADVSLIRDFAANRAPVSEILGIGNHPGLFVFSHQDHDLILIPELEAVAAYQVSQGVFKLFDLLAAKMPTWERLAQRLPFAFDSVELYFCPDRLGISADPAPFFGAVPAPMVFGPFAAEGREFIFPYGCRW